MNSIQPIFYLNVIAEFWEKNRFSKKPQAELFLMISTPLNAGVQLSDIAKHIRVYGNKIQKIIAQNILDLLEKGAKISPAFEGYYDELTLTAIRSGEESGLLSETLAQLAGDLDNQGSGLVMFFNAIKIPLIYVGIVMLTMWAMGKYFLPKISQGATHIPEDLLWLGQLSKIYEIGLVPFLALCALSSFAFLKFARTYTGSSRDDFDSLPFFAFFKSASGAAFISSYSMLRRNKILPASCLKSLSENGTPYIQYHVEAMLMTLIKGQDEVDALDVGLLNSERTSTLRLYATTEDGFVDSLSKAAKILMQDQSRNIKKIGSRTGSALMVFTFINVGWLALAYLSVSDITHT